MLVMINYSQNTVGLDSLEQDEAMQVLREIGQQLDSNIFPLVKNGGLVAPNPEQTDHSTSVKEKQNEKQRQRRSKTRSRAGSERGQGKASRSRQASTATSVLGRYSNAKQVYEQQFEAIRIAYPSIKIWQQTLGLWLITESSVLPGEWHKASFVTGLSYVYPFTVRSWGFWISGVTLKPVWIGPRHTNFPDGSICAFERSDETWCEGQSIVTLLDLYTLWALRHRHLEAFGRWPGRQAVHHPYERILELKPDEFCGCDKSEKLYADCCRSKDLSLDRVAVALDFRQRMGGGERIPPKAIVDFVCNRENPPVLNPMITFG